MEKVAARVCALFKIEKAELVQRSRLNNISKGRELLVYWSNKELGISGREVASYLGISSAAICKKIRLGEKLAREGKYKLNS